MQAVVNRGISKAGRVDLGGAEGARTPDLLNAIQALYQLSYDPIQSGANLKMPCAFVKVYFPNTVALKR